MTHALKLQSSRGFSMLPRACRMPISTYGRSALADAARLDPLILRGPARHLIKPCAKPSSLRVMALERALSKARNRSQAYTRREEPMCDGDPQ